MRRIGDIAWVSIFSSLLTTVVGVSAVMWLGERGLLAFILAGPFSSFLLGHLFVARLPGIRSHPTPLQVLVSQLHALIRVGAAFMAAALVATLGQLAVRTLVQRDLGAVDLGYFQSAWLISMTYIGFVLGAMSTDYYPRLTAVIHDHNVANRLVNEQTEVALLLAGPVLLAMLAFVPWVVGLLYSNEFMPAVSVLRWQILGDVLKIASWPLGYIILAAGDGRTFMLSESAAMAIFVGSTWILLPWLGIQATGVSFLIMYSLILPLMFILARGRTGFRWTRTVICDFLLLIYICLCGIPGRQWERLVWCGVRGHCCCWLGYH